MQHISEEDLEAYALHHPCPVETIEEHLLICEQCQDSLAQLDEEIALVRFTFGDERALLSSLNSFPSESQKAPGEHRDRPLTKSAGS